MIVTPITRLNSVAIFRFLFDRTSFLHNDQVYFVWKPLAYTIVRPACKPGYRGSGLRQLGPQDTCRPILSEVLACAPLPALFDCHRRSDCSPGKQFLSTIIDSSLLAIQCCFIQSLSKENWPSRPPNCVPRQTLCLGQVFLTKRINILAISQRGIPLKL